MSRIVRCGLIQASNALGGNHPLKEIKKAMIEKHLKLIEQAAKKKEPTTPPRAPRLLPTTSRDGDRRILRSSPVTADSGSFSGRKDSICWARKSQPTAS